MSKFKKLILKLLAGTSDNNFDFKDLLSIIGAVWFFMQGKRQPSYFFQGRG